MSLFSVKGVPTHCPLQCCPFEDVVSAETTEEPYLFAAVRGGGFLCSLLLRRFFFFWSVFTKSCSVSGPNALKFSIIVQMNPVGFSWCFAPCPGFAPL